MKISKKLLLIYLAANLSSFSQVGIQKLVGVSPEQAAFNNYYSYGREFSPISLIYGRGAEIGHKVFYNQDDFREVAQSQLENTVQGDEK